jgi:hypothetical protein
MKITCFLLTFLIVSSALADNSTPPAATDPVVTQINQMLAPLLLAVVAAAVAWVKGKLTSLQNTQDQHAAQIHANALATPAPSQQLTSTVVKILTIGLIFTFASCTAIQSDVAKAKSWATSPTGQTVLSDVTTGLSIAALADPSIAPALGAVSLAVRGLETTTAPTTAQIAATIQSVGGSSKAAAIAAPLVSTALQSANGLPNAAALEQIAVAADKAFIPAQ